jgi:hypothetical protein
MNGTDWSSPAANLQNIEAEIKEVLAATGVHVPSLMVGGNAPATLPLPLAALASLTITFKLDKASEFLHGVARPTLESTMAQYIHCATLWFFKLFYVKADSSWWGGSTL